MAGVSSKMLRVMVYKQIPRQDLIKFKERAKFVGDINPEEKDERKRILGADAMSMGRALSINLQRLGCSMVDLVTTIAGNETTIRRGSYEIYNYDIRSLKNREIQDVMLELSRNGITVAGD